MQVNKELITKMDSQLHYSIISELGNVFACTSCRYLLLIWINRESTNVGCAKGYIGDIPMFD